MPKFDRNKRYKNKDGKTIGNGVWFDDSGVPIMIGQGRYDKNSKTVKQYNSDGTVTTFTRQEWVRKQQRDHEMRVLQNDRKYAAPYLPEKAMTIHTNIDGKAGTINLSENQLDSIAVNAKRAGLPFQTALGIAYKESTIGQHPERGLGVSLVPWLKTTGNPFDKTDELAQQARKISYDKVQSPTLLISNWKQKLESPYAEYIYDSKLKLRDSKQSKEGLRTEQYYDDNFLSSLYNGNRYTLKDENPLEHGFREYKKRPDKWNPGEKGYENDALLKGRQLADSPEIREYMLKNNLHSDGGQLQRKSWNDLSMSEKSAMIKVAVSNGITDLKTIREKYNEFAEGGSTNTDRSYNNWKRQIAKQRGIRIDEDNTYDYEAYFNKYPEEAWKMLKGDPTAHFTDEFKTVYHPTFSSKSIGNDGSIYSGVKNPRTNPQGLVGGTWSPDYKVFTMSPDGYRGPVSMDERKWYLENAEDNGVQLREADGSLPIFDGILWGGVLPNVTVTGNKFDKGGSIHIAPSKKGTFTAAASKHGKSVQEFASQVLAHKENYSPAMVKKANFARNARKWKHGLGGPLVEDAMAHYYDGTSEDSQQMNIMAYYPEKDYFVGSQSRLPEVVVTGKKKKPYWVSPKGAGNMSLTAGEAAKAWDTMVTPVFSWALPNVFRGINGLQNGDIDVAALEALKAVGLKGLGSLVGNTTRAGLASGLNTAKAAITNPAATANAVKTAVGTAMKNVITPGSAFWTNPVTKQIAAGTAAAEGINLATNMLTPYNSWGEGVSDIINQTTGWNPQDSYTGRFLTEATNPGWYVSPNGVVNTVGRVGSAVENVSNAARETADKLGFFIQKPGTYTRGIGMTDAGLQDAVETGVFRGNPRGTEQTAKAFDKMFLKNRNHFRDIVKDTGIRGIESRYQSRTLTKEDFDALKKAAQKYIEPEKTKKIGTIRLGGTSDPLSDYSNYEDYIKVVASDMAKTEQMPSRMASGEIVPNTELSEPMWFEDESGKMLLPKGRPFLERFGPNSDYLADGTPLSYWYADGRNPITKGYAYAKSNYGVRVNNPEDYQPFMHELHLHPSFFRSPKFSDPNVEIFGRGPFGVTVKLDKETLQPIWKRNLSNILSRKMSIKTPQITAKDATSMTPEQWTAAQDAAIARGDMAEAQRLRDLHFKVQFPDNVIVTKEGEPIRLYHGTNHDRFNIFDRNKFGEHDNGSEGFGFYFSPNKNIAQASAISEPSEYYVYSRGLFNSSTGAPGEAEMIGTLNAQEAKEHVAKSMDDLLNGEYYKQAYKNINSDRHTALNSKYDSKSFDADNLENAYEIVATKPNQIKSADAVTYDDNGVRIPLGKRDNFNINDIRYGLLPFLGLGAAGTLYGKQE